MNNNPKCRAAFIAAMEAAKMNFDLSFTEHNDGGWVWGNGITSNVFDGFCQAWNPPADVDPESILGRLKAMQIDESHPISWIANSSATVHLPDIIELIESLQQQASDGIAGIQQSEAVNSELLPFLKDVTLMLQTTMSDKKTEAVRRAAMFQRAYRLYVKYDADGTQASAAQAAKEKP